MFSWFRNMKLGMKIGGGFALILLIGIFMAYMGYNGLSTVDQKVQLANGSAYIVEGALNLRQIEKDYMLTMDENLLEDFNAEVDDITAEINKTRSLMQEEADRKEMDHLKEDLDLYRQAFLDYLNSNESQQKYRSEYVNYEESLTSSIYQLLDTQQSELDNLLAELNSEEEQLAENNNLLEGSEQQDSTVQETAGQNEDIQLINKKIQSLAVANDLVDSINMLSIEERNFIINLADPVLQERYIEATNELFPEAIAIANNLKNNHLMEEADKEYVAGLINQIEGMQETFKEIENAEYDKDEQKPVMESNAVEFVNIANSIQDESLTEAAEVQVTANTALLTAIVFALIIGILLAVVITRSLTKPINQAVRIGKSIAENDLTEDVPEEFIDRKDEIGDLAKAFDLMINNLNEIITRISLAAENVSGSAEEISSGNQDLSQRTEEQASSLEEFSATIEEITSSMDSSSANATEADTLSNQTMKSVKEGQTVVDDMLGAMQDITQSSNEIAEIISTVNDIAFQTNLLALNAAVEAARAGESGRGFAVVAAEVRNLAGRSAESAEEIEKLINKSISRIDNGNDLMKETSTVLDTIVENTQKTNDVVSEIAASLSEQSKAADEIRNTIEELNQVTQQNSSLVEEIASSSENMSAEAVEMAEQVDRFKLTDERSRKRTGHNRKSSGQYNNPVKTKKGSVDESIDTQEGFDNFNADDFEKF